MDTPALLAANLKLLYAFIRDRMRPAEIARFGSVDDAANSLIFILAEAFDIAARKGLAHTTVFYNLARYRMDRLLPSPLIVVPVRPLVTAENERRRKAAKRAPGRLPEKIPERTDPFAAVDAADAQAYLHRTLRERLSATEHAYLARRFGLHGLTSRSRKDAAPGVDTKAARRREDRLLAKLRTQALADLL